MLLPLKTTLSISQLQENVLNLATEGIIELANADNASLYGQAQHFLKENIWIAPLLYFGAYALKYILVDSNVKN